VVIAVILLSIAVTTFSHYGEKTSANRAAMVFARDLTLARSMAVRGRQTVTILFDETNLWYTVTTSDGRTLARRQFGATGDVSLSAATLELTGDSLQFSGRGVGNLGGASLGTATFTAGDASYRVTFNSMGASKVDVH
jgi:Tfp pilus assembly protein FimT